MNDAQWILIDTETTGLAAPIFVVEIAAQKMCGWKPIGPPFRKLLNQNAAISPEASRVHGYTREILERDGDPALDVYRDFDSYVDGLPIVAYNLSFDLDDVLLPEWARLGIQPIGTAGFCALRLAQRLLDPVPAGNCKLQTLRQYYRLPERGAHTALGDVDTVADLIASVLQPIAEQRGLKTWEAVCGFTRSEWYPSRIAFGKHKGRNFREAHDDRQLLGWLQWLFGSSNQRSARMGAWYLKQLETSELLDSTDFTALPNQAGAGLDVAFDLRTVAIYVNPAVEQLQNWVAATRARLAELEAQYTRDHHAVEVVRAAIFGLLKKQFQSRDRLRLIIQYRQKYLSSLLQSGEEDAERVNEEYDGAKAKSDAGYESLDAATVKQKSLSDEDEIELKALWKKLVRLYHPDRYAGQPEMMDAHNLLTSSINQARDAGDLKTLREIANDPHGFMLRMGWSRLDFGDLDEARDLRRLLETLQLKVVAMLESLNELHESPDYELQQLSAAKPDLLEEVAQQQAVVIETEIEQLDAAAKKLELEIQELSGSDGLNSYPGKANG